MAGLWQNPDTIIINILSTFICDRGTQSSERRIRSAHSKNKGSIDIDSRYLFIYVFIYLV